MSLFALTGVPWVYPPLRYSYEWDVIEAAFVALVVAGAACAAVATLLRAKSVRVLPSGHVVLPAWRRCGSMMASRAVPWLTSVLYVCSTACGGQAWSRAAVVALCACSCIVFQRWVETMCFARVSAPPTIAAVPQLSADDSARLWEYKASGLPVVIRGVVRVYRQAGLGLLF